MRIKFIVFMLVCLFCCFAFTKMDKRIDQEYKAWQKDIKQLDKQKDDLEKLLKSYNDELTRMTKATTSLETAISQSQLMNATKQMQEMQMSFNLQYLQLQNSMQNENRQFTMVSNIMKTKHETVKNSISNIR
jgi:septal ring factor EnvC (AmiA/AmiB activator)